LPTYRLTDSCILSLLLLLLLAVVVVVVVVVAAAAAAAAAAVAAVLSRHHKEVAYDNDGILMTQTSVKYAQPSHKNWQTESFTPRSFSLVSKTAHT